MPRSNIAVDDRIASVIAAEAERSNMTMYGFSNDCLEAASKIFQEGGRVDEIYPFWRLVKLSKEVDGMPLFTRGLMDSIVSEFYPKNREILVKLFFDYGVFFGTHVKLRAKNLDALWNLIQLFRTSLPHRVFEMDRKEDQSGTVYVMRFVSGISDETTICTGKYMEGLFSCYSSDIRSRTSSSGVVEIEIRQNPLSDSEP